GGEGAVVEEELVEGGGQVRAVGAETYPLSGRHTAWPPRPSSDVCPPDLDVQATARGVDDEDRLMPATIVVPRRAEGAVGAVVNVVGAVLHVPGAQVAVDEIDLVPVEGAGDVLVDDSPHPGVGAGLEPYSHGEGE